LVSIQFDDEVRVGIRAAHVGGKSLRFQFQVESADGETAFARGEAVMVAFNHAENKSRRVPQDWRQKLAAFEQNDEFLA
jgi:acyl-CoA thioester hydrolase